jgi:hypothetical protein
MGGWIMRHGLVVMAISFLLFMPGLALGSVLPQNMEFNPPPRVGDTSVSGACSQEPGCVGIVEIYLMQGELKPLLLGTGTCVDGMFSIDLCTPPGAPGAVPTPPCLPYALQEGDVIQAIQSFSEIGGGFCDSTAEFALRAGIPALNQWGVIVLCLLLAFSAFLVIRKRQLIHGRR